MVGLGLDWGASRSRVAVFFSLCSPLLGAADSWAWVPPGCWAPTVLPLSVQLRWSSDWQSPMGALRGVWQCWELVPLVPHTPSALCLVLWVVARLVAWVSLGLLACRRCLGVLN